MLMLLGWGPHLGSSCLPYDMGTPEQYSGDMMSSSPRCLAWALSAVTDAHTFHLKN